MSQPHLEAKTDIWAPGARPRLNILILYDEKSTHVGIIREHLESFGLYSANNIFYAVGANDVRCKTDFSLFDAVIIHYSVRLSLEHHLSPSYARALTEYQGLKLLFIQDEYDTTETARRWMEKLGLNIVFTCVPPEFLEKVYPSERFPEVKFIQVLTGYVPNRLPKQEKLKPISERRIVLGYRGRPLPYWYGDLGREKITIGLEMKKYCLDRGVPADIEWDEDQRIYGPAWYDFLSGCKATLGTESGANIFDEHGLIRRNVEQALAENPDLTYEEAFERFMAQEEGRIRMNQAPPKIFEAVSFKTALVLFEGGYSGLIEPNRHYIPINKDFSNIEEVFRKLADDDFLQEMVDRTYRDLVLSGKYTYQSLVQKVDRIIESRLENPEPSTLVMALVGRQRPYADQTFVSKKPVIRSEYIRTTPTGRPLADEFVPMFSGFSTWQNLVFKFKKIIFEKLLNHPRLFSRAQAVFRRLPPSWQRLIYRFI